jgi:hypothetical protein
MNCVKAIISIHIYTIDAYNNMCHNYRLVQIVYTHALIDIKIVVKIENWQNTEG